MYRIDGRDKVEYADPPVSWRHPDTLREPDTARGRMNRDLTPSPGLWRLCSKQVGLSEPLDQIGALHNGRISEAEAPGAIPLNASKASAV